MKSVQLVPPGHILGIWEIIWPMLNVAFINYEHGDYDIEQLKVLLIKEFQILFVVVEDNKIIGSLTVIFCVFTIDVVPFIVKLPVASISPVIFKSPTKSNLVDGVDNPIPTLPLESITNGDESGLVESSTKKEF